MAEAWLAHDLELDRPVALKFLTPTADRARFEREARAAAALAHPNVTRLYDYGEHDGRVFMALEYLPGGTLEDRLADGQRLRDEETAAIAKQLATGLAHAHARGLVHRDVKPANVLFDEEDRLKLADFGIAWIAGGDTITETGTVMGTPAYISPEQAAGESVGPASDVYSFGVLLYRMLTGRLPFESDAPVELAYMHLHVDPPPVDVVRPDVPRDLAALTTAALAKDPTARPADGAALAARLGAPSSASPAAAAETVVLPRRRRRRPAWILPVAALVVLAAAGAAVAVLLTHDTSSSPPATTSASTTRAHQTTAASTPPPTTQPTSTRTRAPRPATTATTPSVPAVVPSTAITETVIPTTAGTTTTATTTG